MHALEQEVLAALASRYANEMTSIRGRRVHRLLMREFAGAEYALIGRAGSGAQCFVGLSSTGAAICITEGKGKYAAVQRWAYGASQVTECRFDLHKDSLPLLALSTVILPRFPGHLAKGDNLQTEVDHEAESETDREQDKA